MEPTLNFAVGKLVLQPYSVNTIKLLNRSEKLDVSPIL